MKMIKTGEKKIISYCYATFILFETILSCDLQVINWFFDDYYLGKNHTGVCIYVKFCFIKVLFILFYFHRKEVGYKVSKGDNFTLSISKAEVDLTPEMIQRYKLFSYLTLIQFKLIKLYRINLYQISLKYDIIRLD